MSARTAGSPDIQPTLGRHFGHWLANAVRILLSEPRRRPTLEHVGTVLNAALEQLGWGYQRFLREYRQTARKLGYTNDSVSERSFDRWCAGHIGLPRAPAPDVLSHMFNRPAAELFRQAPPTAVVATSNEEDTAVHRRQVLRIALAASAAGVTVAADEVLERSRRAMDTVLESGQLSNTTLERWDQAAHKYAADYQITAPPELLSDVLADFDELQILLTEPRPARIRASLSRSSAQLAVMAAICLSAMGSHRQARGWLHTARLAAEDAGDPALAGLVMARTSIVTLYYGSPGQALADASTAKMLLGNTGGPAAARAHVVAARAMARLGYHPDGVMAELEAATSLHTVLTPAERTDTAFGYTDRQFIWHTANALTLMGRVQEALPLQQQALMAYRPGEQLDPALIRLDMAAGVLAVDVDEAARQATKVWQDLPPEHRTGMINAYIRRIVASVPASAAGLPAVKELSVLAGPALA